jgi:hypothetical protein
MTPEKEALRKWWGDVVHRRQAAHADLDAYALHEQSGRMLGPAASARRLELVQQLGELAVEFHWCMHALALVGAS